MHRKERAVGLNVDWIKKFGQSGYGVTRRGEGVGEGTRSGQVRSG